MDWLVVIILGIIEGITEFLPISSTGHLLMAQAFLPKIQGFSSEQLKMFDVVIQSGAVLAVIVVFSVWGSIVSPVVAEATDGLVPTQL